MLIQNEFVCCLYCWLWTYFTPCSSFLIINIEQVNAGWETSLDTRKAHYIKSATDLFNPIQMSLFWTAHGWRKGEKTLHPKVCHIYPAVMKLGAVVPYLKKIQKICESRDSPLEFRWHQYFFTGNQQILLYQDIQI